VVKVVGTDWEPGAPVSCLRQWTAATQKLQLSDSANVGLKGPPDPRA